MALAIHLMGRPRIDRDGVAAASPKGRKPWALLAYLLGRRGAVSRQELAALLFSDANDPLGALRWNLVELRRLLGDARILRGDPLRLDLPPGCFIDIRTLESGTWTDASEVPGLGHQFLEGMEFPASAAFEMWLLSERRRVAAAAQAALREATLARLAAGQAESAIDLAARLVVLDPLVEEHQALLIRSYAASGDHVSASRQLAACVELFRQEMGAEPGSLVRSAVDASPAATPIRQPAGAAAARAQLEAGQAALAAGMLEPGLERLYRAISQARDCSDDQVRARALFALGSALAHAGRHRRTAAASALHEVIALGERVREPAVLAAAHRELAWLEVMAARYGRAQQLLSHAAALADQDAGEQATILMILGMCSTDVGRYQESLDLLENSVDLAEACANGKQLAYSLSWLGRARLLRRELGAARRSLERAQSVCRSQGWLWITALPESFLGEVEMLQGNMEAAGHALEHALAIACRVGDVCFESLAARGLGLLEARRGDMDAAVQRLENTRIQVFAAPDYTWSMAYVLDALCATAVEARTGPAAGWINDLESLGGRTGMCEFVARAYIHRAQHGDQNALQAARLIATEIDNPHLHALLASPPAVARTAAAP